MGLRQARLGELRRGERSSFVLELHDALGRAGRGEASPLPGYSPETPEQAWRALRAVDYAAVDPAGWRAAGQGARLPPSAAFALEAALAALAAQAEGLSLETLLSRALGGEEGPPPRDPLESALLPDGLHGEALVAEARAQLEGGRPILKLKTRGYAELPSLGEDLAALRAGLPAVRLRLDGNRRCLGGDLPRLLALAAEHQVELFEEPAPLSAVAALGRSPVPLALDESLQDERLDWTPLAARGLVAALVLKPSTLGLARALRLAAHARAGGLGLMVTHCFEGALGQSLVAALARAVRADSVAIRPSAGTVEERRAWRWLPPRAAPPFGAAACAVEGARGLSRAELEGELARRGEAWAHWPSGQRVAWVAGAGEDQVLGLLALLDRGLEVALLHPRWVEGERLAFAAAARALSPWPVGGQAPPAPGAREAPPTAGPPRPPGQLLAALEGAPAEGGVVLWTSGTRGAPTGVVLSLRQLLDGVEASARALPLGGDERSWLALPPAHVGGLQLILRALHARSALVLPEQPTARFAAERVHDELVRRRITRLSLVPTALARLLALDLPPPPSLRAALLGGAAAPASLVEAGLSRGWPLWLTYGLTEAAAMVTLGPAGSAAAGLPLPGVELRLDDQGELHLRGARVAERTVRGEGLLDGEGWLATGDLGRLERGALVVLGRRAERIISGGENVHPAEVEEALLSVKGIAAACVVGLPHPEWGEQVAAALVARGPPVPEASLGAALAARLAPFKRPRRLRWVEALPEGALGKVDRAAVRRLFE